MSKHISVKSDPDWAIGIDKNHQKNDHNVDASNKTSNKRIKKELQDNSSNVDMEQTTAESSSNEPMEANVTPGEPFRVTTPGYHRRCDWYYRERTSNFSSEDNQIFRDIIDKYSETLFDRKTNSATNAKKKAAWVKIEVEFNAVASKKRTMRQLQAKLDNIKRNRRKKANDPEASVYTPPIHSSPTTDNERCNESDNTVSMDGFNSNVDDNAFNVEVQITELQTGSEEPHSTALADPLQSDSPEVRLGADSPAPTPLDRPPQAKKSRVRKKENNTDESIMTLRKSKLEAVQNAREYDRMLFITKLQHLEEKRKEEREIHELMKRKLELEISLLEKK